MRVLLVVYDNDSYIHVFPLGIAYIASALKSRGIDVEIYSQDLHHYPDEHLTAHLDANKYDAVGVSTIGGYYQYRKLLSISDAINKSKNRPFYMIGGHGPAPEPEFFMRKTGADAVAIGEGEITVVELMDAVASGKSLKGIKGIAYREGDNYFINERRPLIKDIDTIPLPAWEMLPIEYYRLCRYPNCERSDFTMSVISGRGCTFKCNFCYRMDEGFRPRGIEPLVDEIKRLNRDYGINYIGFADELTMASRRRTVELCESFIREKLNIRWSCNGRLNYARKDILSLMKQAGCVFINYGIEAVDDQILKNMNKALTVKQINTGIDATLEAGISPGLNIIFGNIGENRATLDKGVEFLLKHDDGAQLRTIRPVTPYPGSPLYYYAIENGLLKDAEDFYENKHLNSDLLAINFTDMSDREFHAALFEANNVLISNYFDNKKNAVIEQARALYMDTDTTFRGFRDV